MSKTAIQQAIESCKKEFERAQDKGLSKVTGLMHALRILKSLLPVDKEQLEDAYNKGKYHAENGNSSQILLDGEDYYNNTYNKEGE